MATRKRKTYKTNPLSLQKIEALLRKLNRESEDDRAKLNEVYTLLFARVKDETDHDKYSDYMRGLLDVLGKLISSREPLVKAVSVLAKVSAEVKKIEDTKASLEDSFNSSYSYDQIEKLINDDK